MMPSRACDPLAPVMVLEGALPGWDRFGGGKTVNYPGFPPFLQYRGETCANKAGMQP
jgi:hypothetical protein